MNREQNRIVNENSLPVVLTIAGSDSGGGAGIQADLRTFAALKVFGTSAITAITAQNPEKVCGIYPLPSSAVAGQIAAVTDVFCLKAVKTGMLFSLEVMEETAEKLKLLSCPVVTDPVMISTSGRSLMQKEALSFMQKKILPLAHFITPNIPEAEYLSGKKILCEKDMFDAAAQCRDKYNCTVIIKGGHFSGNPEVPDVIWGKDGERLLLRSLRLDIKGKADHGTGCTFSAALAAFLAKGYCRREAAVKAKIFVLASLMGAISLSSGTSSSTPLMGMYPPSGEIWEKAEKMVQWEKF